MTHKEMATKLNQLQASLPDLTSERSWNYWKAGHVLSVKKTGDHVFEAKVKGNEIYTIRLNLESEIYECTCPAEKPCKHIGAVAWAILQQKTSDTALAKNSCGLVIALFSLGGSEFWLMPPTGQPVEFSVRHLEFLKEPLRKYFQDKGFHSRYQYYDLESFVFQNIEELNRLPDVLFVIDINQMAGNPKPLKYAGTILAKSVWREIELGGRKTEDPYPLGYRKLAFKEEFVAKLPGGKSYTLQNSLFTNGKFFLDQDRNCFYRVVAEKIMQDSFDTILTLEELETQKTHPLYPKYQHALEQKIRHGPALLLSINTLQTEPHKNSRKKPKVSLVGQLEIAYAASRAHLHPDSTEPLYTISLKAAFDRNRWSGVGSTLVEHRTGKILLRRYRREHELLRKAALLTKRPQEIIKIPRKKWGVFFTETIELLRQSGVIIKIHENVLGVIRKPKGIIEITGGSGIDWFSGKIRSDDLPENDWKEFVMAVRRKDELVQLKSGRWLNVTGSELASLVRFLDRHGLKIGEDGSVPEVSFATLAALEAEQQALLRTKEGADAARQKIRDFFDQPAGSEQPDNLFLATLRPYQLEGMQFLLKLQRAGLGGILADDMGLGKTIQAIATMSYLAAQPQAIAPRFMVICPVAALSVWEDEIRRFAPHLTTCRWHGNRDERGFYSAQVIITSYGTFRKDHRLLCRETWEMTFIDEAQFAKNEGTATARTLRKLRAKSIICLTGTPLENSLQELWSLFDLAFPGYLGTATRFREYYGHGLEVNDPEKLQKVLQPFMLRRRKADVLQDLPEKSEIVIKIPMTEEQARVYEAARRKALLVLQEPSTPLLEMLKQLNIMRLIACHPYLEDETPNPAHSGKFTYLSDILDELLISARGVLFFSQFLKPLQILRHMLQKRGIEAFYLDGSTPQKERRQLVARFQAGEAKVFLISLRAGGTALTLTRADTVIHLDPWWNPAVESQATDRSHRIGQDRKVMVYKLVSENSVEEKVLQLQDKKRELFNQIINSQAVIRGKISRDDILALL